MLRTIRTTMVLGLLAGVLSAPPALAALIEVDLLVASDALVTRDTASGLDWLDLTATLGLSTTDALAAAVVSGNGFSLATEAQVIALFANAGFGISAPLNVPDYGPASELLAKMGCTSCAGNFPEGKGHLLDNGGPGIQNYLYSAQINIAEPRGRWAPSNFDNGAAVATVGSFMVRASPVPEPTTAVLLLGGLALVAAGARRS